MSFFLSFFFFFDPPLKRRSIAICRRKKVGGPFKVCCYVYERSASNSKWGIIHAELKSRMGDLRNKIRPFHFLLLDSFEKPPPFLIAIGKRFSMRFNQVRESFCETRRMRNNRWRRPLRHLGRSNNRRRVTSVDKKDLKKWSETHVLVKEASHMHQTLNVFSLFLYINL